MFTPELEHHKLTQSKLKLKHTLKGVRFSSCEWGLLCIGDNPQEGNLVFPQILESPGNKLQMVGTYFNKTERLLMLFWGLKGDLDAHNVATPGMLVHYDRIDQRVAP